MTESLENVKKIPYNWLCQEIWDKSVQKGKK